MPPGPKRRRRAAAWPTGSATASAGSPNSPIAERVEDRHHWFVVFLQRFGQLSALSQFLLGATLGFGLDFWPAFWAFTLGAIILEIVSIFTGIAGMREGLSTSLLTRWTGFGRYGSS